MSDATVHRLSEVFKLLADKSRLKILMALAQGGEQNVKELREMLGQSQPAVSHHLTLLRLCGLVECRRDGKHNYYRLDSVQLRELLEQVFVDHGAGPKQLRFKEFTITYRRK